jgi:hypothetical protein
MKLADTQAIAIFMRRPAATIRKWAHLGLLRRHGTDHHGRALYNLDEAEQLLQHKPPQKVDNPPDVREHKLTFGVSCPDPGETSPRAMRTPRGHGQPD